MLRRALAPLAVLALVVAGCGDDDDVADPTDGDDAPVVTDPADGDPPEVDPPSGEGATVDVVDLAFQPAALEVEAGTTVEWINGDQVPHTVTSTSGPLDFDESLPAGESASVTFADSGTYEYACTIHPTMTGTVEVP